MTEKRILLMYNAIKNTRNMSKYWQDHPESFIKWYSGRALGKRKIVYSETGVYSSKDCLLFSIGEINRTEEKKKLSVKREETISKKDTSIIRAIYIMCSHGLSSHLASLLFDKDVECNVSRIHNIDKNRELINYCDCKKSNRERAVDITKLCRVSGADIYRDYYKTIMNRNDDIIRSVHKELFGESEDREMFEEVDVDSRFKGAIAEAVVIERALKKGYTISKPVVDGCKYDLIIDENGNLKKAQVRYSTCLSQNKNILKFSLLRKAANGENIKYSKNDVDIFFLYSPVTNDVYRIENNGDMSMVSIVLHKISNYSKSSIPAEDVKF